MTLITARASIYPTEEKEKVLATLLNIFPGSEVEETPDQLIARTSSGERLREIILETHIRDTARSIMRSGRQDGRIIFQLNKQVALMNKISFIDHPVALGSIDVEIIDEDLDKVLDYLAESTVEAKQ
jgi:uncharacterized protein